MRARARVCECTRALEMVKCVSVNLTCFHLAWVNYKLLQFYKVADTRHTVNLATQETDTNGFNN